MDEPLKNNRTYQKLITIIALLFSLFLLFTQIYPLQVNLELGIPLVLGLALAFLTNPGKGRISKLISWLIIGLNIIAVLYVIIYAEEIGERIGLITTSDLVISIIGTLILLEAVRRNLGYPLFVINALALVFAYFGHLLPASIAHKGFDLARIFRYMWLGQEGIFGLVLSVFVNTIFPFLLLGTILQTTGVGKVMIELSFRITRKLTGGIGLAAVIACSLFGAISGSAPANAAATGTFTIPAMKSQGYPAKLAAAIVACASSGGQIMPPVMGAAAFIMAETLGVPYSTIAIAAIGPALLYYFGIAEFVYIEALKFGNKVNNSEVEIKEQGLLRKSILMLIPFVVLIALLAANYSPGMCGLIASFVSFGISFVEPEWRLNMQKTVDILRKTALGSLELLLICGVVGILIGVITMTGFGVKFGNLVLAVSSGHVVIALSLIMIASIILGMGAPTVACYVILAATTAPVLIKMGVLPLAAHFFVFYFGIMSAITPPVALASFTAAGISGSSINETGILAFIMAIPAFIIPYAFVFNPALLLQGSLIDILKVLATATLGVTVFVGGLAGLFIRRIRILERALCIIAGLLLIVPEGITDVIGLILSAILFGYFFLTKNKQDTVSSAN